MVALEVLRDIIVDNLPRYDDRLRVIRHFSGRDSVRPRLRRFLDDFARPCIDRNAVLTPGLKAAMHAAPDTAELAIATVHVLRLCDLINGGQLAVEHTAECGPRNNQTDFFGGPIQCVAAPQPPLRKRRRQALPPFLTGVGREVAEFMKVTRAGTGSYRTAGMCGKEQRRALSLVIWIAYGAQAVHGVRLPAALFYDAQSTGGGWSKMKAERDRELRQGLKATDNAHSAAAGCAMHCVGNCLAEYSRAQSWPGEATALFAEIGRTGKDFVARAVAAAGEDASLTQAAVAFRGPFRFPVRELAQAIAGGSDMAACAEMTREVVSGYAASLVAAHSPLGFS